MIFIFVLLFVFGLRSPPKESDETPKRCDQKFYDNISEPCKDFLDDITGGFFNREEKVQTKVLQ